MEITIDLETTALDPNAGVMQIAAVAWKRGGEQFDVYDTFNQGIDLRDLFSRKEQFTFDNNTADWWGKQEEKARKAMLSTTADLLVDAVRNFNDWLVDVFNVNPDEELHIWAQGSDFDIPKLQHLFAVVNMKTPWKYNAVRCARTFALETGALLGLAKSGDIYSYYPEFKCDESAAHDALFDAKRTAYTTWNIIKDLSERIGK